ncbi:hypothetical protein [Deinococcus koreensis]|nr:hypothetical protein [Deinococcus koreensis]
MKDEAVPLSHVLHLLPPSSGVRLEALQLRGIEVQCLTHSGAHGPVNYLVGRVGGRTIRTSLHPWIAPALVQEFVTLAEALMN